MSNAFSYKEYVTDQRFLDGYNSYQQKYARSMRESDKQMLDLIAGCVAGVDGGAGLRLLDVGCSTGNLLLHIRRAWPGLELTGADLAESSLVQARENPELAGVGFEARDLMDLGWEERFDIVVVNAVFYMLDDEHLALALASVARALKPGGHLLAFDFFHPYEQDLAIFERSVTHPEGLMLHFRPMPKAQAMLQTAGFAQAEFRPFVLPIELERSPDPAVLNTFTEVTREGAHLAFRGVLYQPWCHLKARRRA